MNTRLTILTCSLLLTLAASSQITDYSPYITTREVDGKTISVLRVPLDQVNEKIRGEVGNVHWKLDDTWKYFQQGNMAGHYLGGQVKVPFMIIERDDSLFPVHYLREEAAAYERFIDSANKREIRENLARVKRYEDSIHIVKLKEGYRWINSDTVWVRTKPDSKAPSIGRIYRLSYVKGYAVENNPDWAEVEFGEHTGYIPRKDLALKWEDMALDEDELAELKSGRYYSFDPTTAYKAKLDRQAAAEAAALKAANAASRRNYITGPRGGCYFINSSGNKEYVDRRYCR
jgi:hypothetical protein